MQFQIHDEFSELRDVVVCLGTSVVPYAKYVAGEPEFTKYHKRTWDKDLLLRQQEAFFKRLEHYNVTLHFPQTSPDLPWQMYTRDIGFVIHHRLYFSTKRQFSERRGEADELLAMLKKDGFPDASELTTGSIEGGDVVVAPDLAFVGNGSRTEEAAIAELSTKETCDRLFLGDNVMHLDTRFTILPKNHALIVPTAFKPNDLARLKKRFTLLPVFEEETLDLATNVFLVNPETIFSAKHNRRINAMLINAGFHLEELNYTEPINLGGSFRCTTLPLVRG
ncbi:MAG TPA: arginine deiminase family protein [Candidatus Saccharimonadia bacterium]|nr:arginine deiminase family protein [Candidatus Saccharimonadia bacterium]